jgi:hypothetical protein
VLDRSSRLQLISAGFAVIKLRLPTMRPGITTAVGALLVTIALAACGGSSSKTTAAPQPSSTAAAQPSSTAAAGATATTTTGTASGSHNGLSYEGIPLQVGPFLAAADTTEDTPVDGIRCAPVEQLAYHIHAHLQVFDNGQVYALPAGIGIPGSVTEQTTEGPVAAGGHCFYWLHTHTSDGVIHIESPTQRIYTLGQFFDEWHQPLSPTRVGDLHGKISAFVNGKPWTKDVRAIPLDPHAEIQFNIGQPAPPLIHINWAGTGL